MRRPVGVASSAFVATPSGHARADVLVRGDVVLALAGGVLVEAEIRRVDRGLCCSMARFKTGRGSLAAGASTLLGGMALEGGIVVPAPIAAVDHLNFCQHAIHFFCGEAFFVFAGAESGEKLAVDASFMKREV